MTNCTKCGGETRLRSNGVFAGKQRQKRYCPSCERIRLRQYRSSTNAGKRAWDRRNSEKRRAHKLVENALLRGDITRMPCERCGAGTAQAHHDDYSKPLDVMWLCPSHHGERHRELRCISIAA